MNPSHAGSSHSAKRTGTGTALIAYDGSDDAAVAIRHAGRLLAPQRAVVVYVWQSLAGSLLHTDPSGLMGTMREAAAELDDEDRRDAEGLASEGAELARQAGFDAEPRALQGRPKTWRVLLDTADEVDAAVVVIGSRGQGAVKSALLGSVSSALLHHTDRPVLVAPHGEEEGTPAGPVVIGFDGSDGSRAAVDAAGKLLSVREAVVETVWTPYSGVAAGGVIGAPRAVASRAAEELDRSVAARAEQTAHDGVRQAAGAGLEARPEAMQSNGPVWCTLRDSAEAHGSPTIVVGSRGRGSMATAVLGSTSAALVHHAQLPILVVPPEAH
jgi:nucleotide-binding universal stress UspA family protein